MSVPSLAYRWGMYSSQITYPCGICKVSVQHRFPAIHHHSFGRSGNLTLGRETEGNRTDEGTDDVAATCSRVPRHFWLVFGGCGAAVFAADPAGDESVGIGFLGVSLAFGLTVLTGVYALGNISGGHFNPAVTLGAAIAKRVEWAALLPYWLSQVVGGLAAGLLIVIIGNGRRCGRRWAIWPQTDMRPTPRSSTR